jgi:hypothetical protein
MKRKPHSDFTKPTGPQHNLNEATMTCDICGCTWQQIYFGQPCVDATAAEAGRVFARLQRERNRS